MKVLILGKGIANDGVELLLRKDNIEYDYLNPDAVNSIDYKFVVKAPGIPYDNDLILRFLSNNIRVMTDIELAFILRKKFYICITGSNGKTQYYDTLVYITL